MKLLRDNGLTIVLMLANIGTVIGMTLTGLSVYNEELVAHTRTPITLSQYVTSGHYLSALFENWESEFLQMSAYVVLTAFLFQRGSAESKDPDKKEPTERNQRKPFKRRLFEHSLSLTLLTFFILSWLGHGLAGRSHFN